MELEYLFHFQDIHLAHNKIHNHDNKYVIWCAYIRFAKMKNYGFVLECLHVETIDFFMWSNNKVGFPLKVGFDIFNTFTVT